MLTQEQTVLVLVDVQDKLAHVMFEKEQLVEALALLVRGAQTLGLPILWLEQTPAKMGSTIEPLRQLLAPGRPITKTAFSCGEADGFLEALAQLGRTQVLLAGIEAHVCIYQTAVDLLERGFHVEVVAEAVSSRTERNRSIGLSKCQARGAELTGIETALFEIMRTAGHPAFREILKLVK